MTNVFVRANVADYDSWRASYDAASDLRAAGGVQAAYVHRSIDDPNEITVSHIFASPEAARAFAGSPELKAAMQAGGVQGAPQFWFTESV